MGEGRERIRIGVVGLGYVGLPLLAAFSRRFHAVGFDVTAERVDELRVGVDRTRELDADDLKRLPTLNISSDPRVLGSCNFIVVSVPTPLQDDKRPDFGPLEEACRTVGEQLSAGDTVVFESTVFPGATEELCVPILEAVSGLEAGKDFSYGYSPERINPGDPQRRLEDIVKVTSGCDERTAERVDRVYASIVPAGTFRAASVRTAEAAKVIENVQRDVNIALVNELAMLFDRLGLDTRSVLEAAATKWNFHAYRPGLVGGHCIGVDPYYLTWKAEQAGHHPEMILAGRRINDAMAAWVADRFARLMSERNARADARLLVLGLTFKENCPDTRNSQVLQLVRLLREKGFEVDAHDPWVEGEAVEDVVMANDLRPGTYDGILLAVAHREFVGMGYDRIRALGRDECVVFDLKNVIDDPRVDARL